MQKFSFYNEKKSEHQPQSISMEKLVEIQTAQLKNTYRTDCLDAKQLKTVLNVGESHIYEWLKDCKSVRIIGRRKVVPIVWVAHYLVTGQI